MEVALAALLLITSVAYLIASIMMFYKIVAGEDRTAFFVAKIIGDCCFFAYLILNYLG